MTVYVDTSALAAVYLGDQEEAAVLARVIYDGSDAVVTSELTDVEISGAVARCLRDRTLDAPAATRVRSRYRADTADDGAIGVIPLDPATITLAARYVSDAALRTLDAIHLAACSRFGHASSQPMTLLSRDRRQNAAATRLGITLA